MSEAVVVSPTVKEQRWLASLNGAFADADIAPTMEPYVHLMAWESKGQLYISISLATMGHPDAAELLATFKSMMAETTLRTHNAVFADLMLG